MRSLVRNFVFPYAKNNAGISETADWQSQDSYLWADIAIFLGNLSKSLYGTATFSGIAFWDSYFEMFSEIPEWFS